MSVFAHFGAQVMTSSQERSAFQSFVKGIGLFLGTMESQIIFWQIWIYFLRDNLTFLLESSHNFLANNRYLYVKFWREKHTWPLFPSVLSWTFVYYTESFSSILENFHNIWMPLRRTFRAIFWSKFWKFDLSSELVLWYWKRLYLKYFRFLKLVLQSQNNQTTRFMSFHKWIDENS